MKKILDLKEEKNLAFQNLEAIVKKADDEKRAISETEQLEFEKYDVQIKEADKQIALLERSEALKAEFVQKVQPKNVETPEEKLAKRFDLFGAIRSRLAGKTLEGANDEICKEGIDELRLLGQAYDPIGIQIPRSIFKGFQKDVDEIQRAEYGTGDGTPPIPVQPKDFLSVVSIPNIISNIGITYWEGLTGNVPIPRMGQLSAAFVSEKSAVATAGVVLAQNVLSPRRVGATDSFTKELLYQTSSSIQATIWSEYIAALWRAIQKDLLTKVASSATVCSGRTISTATAVLAWLDILLMESTIEVQENPKYIMSNGQKGLLKAKEKASATAQFVWESNNTINGYNAFSTTSLATTNGGSTNTNFDVIFGDFKAAVIGSWGGVELLVNPYASDEKGEIKMTVSGLFDTNIANALNFSVIRNATI
jgi:hypothetical protein